MVTSHDKFIGPDGKERARPPEGWVWFQWEWICPYCNEIKGLVEYDVLWRALGVTLDPHFPDVRAGWTDTKLLRQRLNEDQWFTSSPGDKRFKGLWESPTRWGSIRCASCGGLVWRDYVRPFYFYRKPKERTDIPIPSREIVEARQLTMF